MQKNLRIQIVVKNVGELKAPNNMHEKKIKSKTERKKEEGTNKYSGEENIYED